MVNCGGKHCSGLLRMCYRINRVVEILLCSSGNGVSLLFKALCLGNVFDGIE